MKSIRYMGLLVTLVWMGVVAYHFGWGLGLAALGVLPLWAPLVFDGFFFVGGAFIFYTLYREKEL